MRLTTNPDSIDYILCTKTARAGEIVTVDRPRQTIKIPVKNLNALTLSEMQLSNTEWKDYSVITCAVTVVRFIYYKGINGEVVDQLNLMADTSFTDSDIEGFIHSRYPGQYKGLRMIISRF